MEVTSGEISCGSGTGDEPRDWQREVGGDAAVGYARKQAYTTVHTTGNGLSSGGPGAWFTPWRRPPGSAARVGDVDGDDVNRVGLGLIDGLGMDIDGVDRSAADRRWIVEPAYITRPDAAR